MVPTTFRNAWHRSIQVLAVVAYSLVSFPLPIFGQNVQHTQNNPDIGLRSDTRVDPSTLGMSISIPLASYSGRAGHGLPVAINYSSKVLRLDYRGVDSPPISGPITWTGVEFGEHSTAGWTSTLNPPRVEFTGMGQFYTWEGRSACEDVCVPGQAARGDNYVKRIHIHMPDGSSHELRLDDRTYIHPVQPFTGTFQSVDGSRMRFESNVGTASVLYLPDGSRYLFGPYDMGRDLTATHFIDRNGNTLTYNGNTRQWTDTLNRVIPNPLPANPGANTETHFRVKLIGGSEATYTFRWKNLADVLTPDPATGQDPALRYPGDFKCSPNSYQNVSPSLFTSSSDTKVCVERDQFGNALRFNPVVLAEVVLPTGQSHRFTYTVYGEIDKILLATGGTEIFRYDRVATLSSSTVPYRQTNRGVIERRVSATGNEESLWSYAVISTDPYIVRTTGPDLSHSERLLHRSRYTGVAESFARFGFDDARIGMIYEERTYNSFGVMLRRDLSKWVEAGATDGGNSNAVRDPKVVKQVSILLDSNGNNALTATTVNRYEQASQPLNMTSTTQYGYDSMSKTTAQTASVDFFNPPDALAVRTVETSYLDNPAYFERGLMDLPTATRIRDGAGNLLAQSSINYDEYDTSAFPLLTYGLTVPGWTDPGTPIRGNATTTKNWLNTNNSWIESHAQYDQLGNVRSTWDARGNQSKVFFVDSFSDNNNARNTYAFPTRSESAVADPNKNFGSNTALVTTTVYDFSTGASTSTTDPNNQVTTFSYMDDFGNLDPLGRLRKVTTPDGGWTKYDYGDTPGNLFIRTRVALDATRNTDAFQYFDGRGRPFRTIRFENQDPVQPWLSVDIEYDAMGRVKRMSLPYRSAGGAGALDSAGWENVNRTETTYDSLGRVTTVKTLPDAGTVTSEYSGNLVTITDQAQRKRRTKSDALGRLTQVVEAPEVATCQADGRGCATDYSYDALGNLRKVQQGSQQRFFMYDSLSRLIRAKNPEQGNLTADANFPALTDATSGTSQWSMAYSYDNNGNLAKRKDARNITSIYSYDALNRNTTVSYLNDPTGTPAVSRFYDGLRGGTNSNIPNSKGRLWQTESAGLSGSRTTINEFDALGRAKNLSQQFYTGSWSGAYTSTLNYNLTGHVISQSYPSGRTVSYTYDTAGRTDSFSGNLGDGTQRTYASGIIYSPFGGTAKEQFGTDTPIYNKSFYNSRGQLAEIRVSNSYTGLTDTTWNRGAIINHYSNTCWGACSGKSMVDNNGNLKKQEHWIPDANGNTAGVNTQEFDYDQLNRIQRVREGTGWQQEYVYDRWGNRTIHQANTWGGVPKPNFGVDTTSNRLSAPAGFTMTYDAAGNLTNDTITGEGQRIYDAENHMTQAWANGQWQIYTYNGDGQRTRRKVNGVETWQIYGLGGELLSEYAANGAVIGPKKEYGYRNGQLLVTAEPGTGASSGGPPSSGLVGSWKFNENTSTSAADSSGSGNTGTLTSGASWTSGQSGAAINLDGADDYVQIGVRSNLAVSNTASFSAWIHPTGPGSNGSGIIVNREGEYEIARFADGTIQWAFANTSPGWNWVNTGQIAPLNQWTHVTVTYESGVVKTYINGVLKHTYNGSGAIVDTVPSQNDFRIGGRQCCSQHFQGRIDEVQVFNRCLSASEVSGLVTSPTSGLAGYWKLNENSGTSAADSSGSGNTGTLTSGASWTSGQSGSAVNFDGLDDYVQVGVRSNLVISNTASLSAWIHPTGPGSNGSGIIVNREGEYEIARFADGTIQWAFANTSPGWNWVNTGQIAPLNQWTHVTVTYESGVVKTYINGVLKHTHNGSGAIVDTVPSQNDFRIGGRQCCAQNFQGRLDEVQVYNRALSASEVSTLANGSGGGSPAAVIQWVVSDHLGTPRMILDKTGSLTNVKRHDYLPFGEELFAGTRTSALGYGGGDGVRQKFTGYERDFETDLDFAQARYYSNEQGRFTSIDPLLASGRPNKPQSWNRYTYVLNNPLRLVDPTGLRDTNGPTPALQPLQQPSTPQPSQQQPSVPPITGTWTLSCPPPYAPTLAPQEVQDLANGYATQVAINTYNAAIDSHAQALYPTTAQSDSQNSAHTLTFGADNSSGIGFSNETGTTVTQDSQDSIRRNLLVTNDKAAPVNQLNAISVVLPCIEGPKTLGELDYIWGGSVTAGVLEKGRQLGQQVGLNKYTRDFNRPVPPAFTYGDIFITDRRQF